MNKLVEVVNKRLSSRTPEIGPSYLRPAAVLVPILVQEAQGKEKLILTRRSELLRRQPGDISFPGGEVEHIDSSLLETALRESREEVGLKAKDVRILGQMEQLGTSTGFCITPFVGCVKGPYPFQINQEVSSLIEVPIADLCSDGVLEVKKRRSPDGAVREVYHYHFRGHDIWGITGRLIKEFLELLTNDQ